MARPTTQATPRRAKTRRKIALVAHDNRKADLLEWVRFNHGSLSDHDIVATGTTGKLIQSAGIDVMRLLSGPLGGDQQLGAMIAQGEVDLLIFFWDPLEPQPHDPDVKALLRVSVMWNVVVACNRATADYVISSPLFRSGYAARLPSFVGHDDRPIPAEVPNDTVTGHADRSGRRQPQGGIEDPARRRGRR